MGKNKSVKNAEKTKSKHSKNHTHDGKKKERGIVPYIQVPFIYVLISLVIALPLFISFVNFSVKTVHNFQKDFAADYNDYSVNSTKFDEKTLDYEKLNLCEKVGVLKCGAVGINQNVYYGINRVSLRNGVGLSTDSSFSDNISLNAAGYSKGALKGLNNIKEGDVITFETVDKIYEFTVVKNSVGDYSAGTAQSGLVISCDNEAKAFSAMGKNNRYVVCELNKVQNAKGE